MDYQISWVNTVVKTAPMLGLQGTVLGMIAAFGKIAAKQATGVNPASLAEDISFALITTAVGTDDRDSPCDVHGVDAGSNRAPDG